MKKITKYKLHITRITFCFLLSAFCLITNAQIDKNRILSADDIQKNELKVTPELEKMVVAEINLKIYSEYGITKAHLENLQLGKPIPWYSIENEDLEDVNDRNVHRMADEKPLSLRFTNTWKAPVLFNGEPPLFAMATLGDFGKYTSLNIEGAKTAERIHNYEHKDLLIGCLYVVRSARNSSFIDFLIIRKEHKDVFVEIYDEATGEYFKNEYSFSELINRIKEFGLREREARRRYYAQFADKTELEITPEITKMLLLEAQSHWSRIRDNDEYLSHFGIKNGAQLEHLHLRKPIPIYTIVNENLTFIGRWYVHVMSNGEFFYSAIVQLEDDGKYSYVGGRSVEGTPNYEHEDLIVGVLEMGRTAFFIIRKDNKDIFVMAYDWRTGEYYKNEYSFSEIINLLKK